VTPNHLSRLFQTHGRMTFSHYLTSVRIDRRSICSELQLKLDDIAARCGYHDTPYFWHVFKKMTKTTPMAYRLRTVRAGRRCGAGGEQLTEGNLSLRQLGEAAGEPERRVNIGGGDAQVGTEPDGVSAGGEEQEMFVAQGGLSELSHWAGSGWRSPDRDPAADVEDDALEFFCKGAQAGGQVSAVLAASGMRFSRSTIFSSCTKRTMSASEPPQVESSTPWSSMDSSMYTTPQPNFLATAMAWGGYGRSN